MNIVERPRFRNDLVAHPFNEGGRLFVEVTDPDSGQTYKFYEIEYAIASAMNGQRDLGGLVAWAAEELGVQTSTDELELVVSTLGDLGYLSGGALTSDRVVPAFDPEPVDVASEASSPMLDVELGFAGSAGPAAPLSDAYDSAANEFDLGYAGAAPAPPEPALDFDMSLELGLAGKSDVPRHAQPLSPSVDVELGLAGVAEAGAPIEPADSEDSFAGLMDDEPRRQAPVTDFDVPPTPPPAEVPIPRMKPRAGSHLEEDDGPTNLPSPMPDYDEEDVSVDLSEHLSIGAEDVKEAVRASKVMQAVEIPAGLLAELEADSAPAPEPSEAALPTPVPPLELPAEPPHKPISKPVARSRKSAPEPEARPAVDASAAAEAMPVPKKRGTSPWLVILLLVVMVGAAAAYYFLVYKKDDTVSTTSKDRPTDRTKKKPPVGTDVKKKPEPVPLPSAKLVAGDAEKEDVLSMKAGPIVWSGDDGAAVVAGDVIAKIAGYNAEDAKIRGAAHDQKRYQKRIDDWTKDKEAVQNEAIIKRIDQNIKREADKIVERQATIDAAQAIIDAHMIKAPSAGTLEMLVSKNERVKEGQTVAAIVGEQGTIAEFTAAKGNTYAADQAVKVAKKAEGSAKVDCVVYSFDAGKVTVACPAGSGLAVGDEVVLE